jgi:hypothetical protein
MVWPDDIRPLDRHDGLWAGLACVLLLGILALMLGCSSPTRGKVGPMSSPSWKWSEPFYAPHGVNVACGAGGKACG